MNEMDKNENADTKNFLTLAIEHINKTVLQPLLEEYCAMIKEKRQK